MEVLFVASESTPFIKTGGLADVVGSLPSELAKLGVDVRVILPKYGDIPEVLQEGMLFKKRITVSLGWRFQHCGIEELEYRGITYYFIENEYYYNRSGIYGFDDDAERFAFFAGRSWKRFRSWILNPASFTAMTGILGWSASF